MEKEKECIWFKSLCRGEEDAYKELFVKFYFSLNSFARKHLEVKETVSYTHLVNGSAAPCRPRNARYVMKYKYARATQEMQDADEDYLNLLQERPYLKITEWSVNDLSLIHI